MNGLARCLVASALLLLAVGCGKTAEGEGELLGLGDACLLSDELNPRFSGYAVTEVVLEDHAQACASEVCLAHGFQGRVGCPYGQAAGERRCRTSSGELVETAVEPQLLERPPSSAMICSCRCAGPGPGPFCDCGEGMECAELFLGLPGAGSYCIP